MKKLITILFVLILLVAGAIGGGTYWLGMGVEPSYQQALNQTGDQSGLILKSASFDQGLLASRATTLVMLPGAHVTAMLDQEISPGPIAIQKFLAGEPDFNPVKYVSSGSIKLSAKKELSTEARKLIGRFPVAALNARSDLLSGKNTVSISVPSFKGTLNDTNMSWPTAEFVFEANEHWNPIQLVSGTTNMKLPAEVVENLIRLRIHLDIEDLKSRRKLSPTEIKKLSPTAARIAVENALPGYIDRYGIKDVLDNARNTAQPITVSFRPGQIKVGGVTLPR